MEEIIRASGFTGDNIYLWLKQLYELMVDVTCNERQNNGTSRQIMPFSLLYYRSWPTVSHHGKETEQQAWILCFLQLLPVSSLKYIEFPFIVSPRFV